MSTRRPKQEVKPQLAEGRLAAAGGGGPVIAVALVAIVVWLGTELLISARALHSVLRA